MVKWHCRGLSSSIYLMLDVEVSVGRTAGCSEGLWLVRARSLIRGAGREVLVGGARCLLQRRM